MCWGELCAHYLPSVRCLVSTTDTAAIVFQLQQHLCVAVSRRTVSGVHIIQLKRWVQLSQLTREETLVSSKTREDLILSSRLLLLPGYQLLETLQCNGDSHWRVI